MRTILIPTRLARTTPHIAGRIIERGCIGARVFWHIQVPPADVPLYQGEIDRLLAALL